MTGTLESSVRCSIFRLNPDVAIDLRKIFTIVLHPDRFVVTSDAGHNFVFSGADVIAHYNKLVAAMENFHREYR